MNKVKIGLTGDFCPWGRIEEAYFSNLWQEIMMPAKEMLSKNDYNILDLECPLTNNKTKINKTGPHLKSKPETAEILKYLNCKHVVTANNHFKDYGYEGMKETYKVLESHGVDWIGSGKNIQEASSPFHLEKNGLKIAVLNMTEYEWSISNHKEPGCNPINFPRAIKTIQNAKSKDVDFVLVILHGGHEHYPLPSPRMKAQFRFMIDAGADAVVGHHTHIISGYEEYKNKPIFYSLGNFCFDWPNERNGTWNNGMVLNLEFVKNQHPKYEYIFTEQNNKIAGVKYVELNKKKELDNKLQKLNETIIDDFRLNQAFDEYIQKFKDIMLTRIQPYSNKWLVALHKRGFLPDMMNSKKKRLIQGLSQNESHREVLLSILSNYNK